VKLHSKLSFLFAVSLQMSFTPLTHEERLEAIGPTHGLPAPLRRALEPGKDFEPIPFPGSGDWLSVHGEPGQTYEAFLKTERNEAKGRRTRIYLQPLGNFTEGRSPALDTLRAYAEAYFAMDVDVHPTMNICGHHVTTRLNPMTKNRQILTSDVLTLLRNELPADAFCVLAVTMEDLYPEPTWNFVFGQASLRERVGVFSFVRYDPVFYGEQERGNDEEVLLRRSLKVLVHETAHMFSLTHCIYFKCVLNGSNHLQESDSRPLSLCPVCLRKLQSIIGFDVTERYRRLLRFYEEKGFLLEARWVTKRLDRMAENRKNQFFT
jgi:archaemetzincin